MQFSLVPSEVWEKIFHSFQEGPRSVKTHTEFILVCSHVCRDWRQTTVGSKRLWRSINLTRPEIARMCLFRSEPLLVFAAIHLPYRIDKHLPSFRMLERHAHRLLSFDVTVAHQILGEAARNFVGTCRNLTWLRFEARSFGLGGVVEFAPESKLEHLELVNCAPLWSALGNLTRLRVNFTSSYVYRSPPLSSFLGLLERSPQIEFIELCEAYWIEDDSPVSTIHLPNLAGLTLRSYSPYLIPPHGVSELLRRLSFPTRTKIVIDYPEKDILPLVPTEVDQWKLRLNTECSMRISLSRLQVYPVAFGRAKERWACEPILSITTQKSRPTEKIFNFGLPFGVNKVKNLDVFGPDWHTMNVMRDQWQSVFLILPELISINILAKVKNINLATNILSALAFPTLPDDSHTPATEIICPHLCHLTFSVPEGVSATSSNFLVNLAAMLVERRKEIGALPLTVRTCVGSESLESRSSLPLSSSTSCNN